MECKWHTSFLDVLQLLGVSVSTWSTPSSIGCHACSERGDDASEEASEEDDDDRGV